MQADGSTRTAAITGAWAALMMAQQRWLESGIIERPFFKESIAAVSIGILENNILVIDPDYHEDSSSVADLNIIMTHSGRLIEVLGGAEKESIDWECMNQAGKLARAGVDEIVSFFDTHKPPSFQSKHATRAPLFSLKNRQQQM